MRLDHLKAQWLRWQGHQNQLCVARWPSFWTLCADEHDSTDISQVEDKSHKRNVPNFPNILGAVGCTRIPASQRAFRNRNRNRNRSTRSANPQAAGDSKRIIPNVVAKHPGSCPDGFISRNGSIYGTPSGGADGEREPGLSGGSLNVFDRRSLKNKIFSWTKG